MPNGWEFFAGERIAWVGRRALAVFLEGDYAAHGVDPERLPERLRSALARWPDPPWSRSRWLYPEDPAYPAASRRLQRQWRADEA